MSAVSRTLWRRRARLRAAFGKHFFWLAAQLSSCRTRRPVEVKYKRPGALAPSCGDDEYFFSQIHGEDFAVSYPWLILRDPLVGSGL